MLWRVLMMAMLFLLPLPPAMNAAEKAKSIEAYAGLEEAKVIFDVRAADLEKLLFNLNLFDETFNGIVAQGVKPDMIVAFRGPGVNLLTNDSLDRETIALFRSLAKKGVRFEACAIAMRVFHVDPSKLIPEVALVANVFNSFIGYQNKGYAMIAIN